jgi:hypothetical protein
MELKFTGQGLDPTSESTAGNLIIDSLGDMNYNTFNAFVAFVSIGGINNIIDQLRAFKAFFIIQKSTYFKVKLYPGQL